MVPLAFVSLDEIPMAPNGKVDRRALPVSDSNALCDVRATGLQPQDDVERTVAGIWRDILSISEVGRDSNFFDLGGDSLRLMRVRARLERAFNREFTMLDLLKCTSIRSLARHIRGDDAESVDLGSSAGIEARREAARRRRELRQRVLHGQGERHK